MRVGRFFFFNDTATTEIYTLSLHDALPISRPAVLGRVELVSHGEHLKQVADSLERAPSQTQRERSEEHTSELQSQSNLVCRLLLEKKNARSCMPRDSPRDRTRVQPACARVP